MQSKKERAESPEPKVRLYRFQFPPDGEPWYSMKSGSIEAPSRGAARRRLVKRGILEPFEARVADITLAG